MKTVGIILVVLGLVALLFQGFTYPKEEEVLRIGDTRVTAKTEERVYIPAVVGGILLIGGIALILFDRRSV